MRSCLYVAALLLVLSVPFSCPAEAGKEPPCASEKPLRAFLALNEEATRVLKLILDESEGTGKGYDTIHADLNLNGDLTDDKPIKGELEKEDGYMTYAFFPTINVDVRDESTLGVKRTWQLTLGYDEYRERRFFGLLPGEVHRSFEMEAGLIVKDSSGEWECFFDPSLDFAEKGHSVLGIPLASRPSLILRVEQDRQKKGAITVAADLTSDWGRIDCTRDGESLPASVQVKDRQGKVLHSEEIPLDRLDRSEFLRGPEGGISLSVPSGRHILEVSVDTGPIAGVVKAAKRLVID